MDRNAALQSFVRVVDSGSFSQAARELGVGQPAISKQVAGLEAWLGVQLLTRTSRGLRPTQSGLELYETAVRIRKDLEDVESRIARRHGQASGTVRIAAPPTLTSFFIVPNLPRFFADFPKVTIELVVSERHVDLVQDGFDMAIRVGALENSGLVARKIGDMQIVTVASPDYLAAHGTPRTPSDLQRHALVTHQYRGSSSPWVFRDHGALVEYSPAGRFSCNDPADMRAAALAGIGVAQSARGLFDADLRAGRLREILSGFAPDPVSLHAVYPTAHAPHRVRVVSDFIKACLDAAPSLTLG